MKEYALGIVWMPAHYSNRVDMIGSRVIANAGKIGSWNNFDSSTNDTNIPKHSTIDMYRNPAKCY